MGKLIFAVIMYFAIPPTIMALGKVFKDRMKFAIYGRQRSRTALAQKQNEGLNRKIKKRLNFSIRDPRQKPIPYRLIFLGIYFTGAIVAGLSAFFGGFKLFLLSILFAYGAVIFSYVTTNKIITERDVTLERMLELKLTKMRSASGSKDRSSLLNIDEELKVIEWDKDLVTPVKMHLYMPTSFDSLEVAGFLESFNLVFNSAGQWVANTDDEHYKGFDFNAGVASIRVSPKLPERADWHIRYLESPEVHWSFFPLAIGSENGVPILNEETGKIEHVLGFAVNSGQEKLSRKRGTRIGNEMTSAPQILIAGGTGGGKALDSNTKVVVKRA